MILDAVLILGGLGFVFAAGLAMAGKFFHVVEDPLKEKIISILPGSNCGACGMAGCSSYADMLVKGAVDINHCTVGRQDVIDKLSKLLGKEAAKVAAKVAVVSCIGGKEECKEKFTYRGIQTCKASSLVGGGFKACDYGCLALGDCVEVCPFDAIEFTRGKPPLIDHSKCTGCGLCVNACPRNVIRIVPESSLVNVVCESRDKGKDVRSICKVGCFACGICVKNCPEKAITIENNLAIIDYSKCTNCGICVEKCPVKCITKIEETVPAAV